MMSTRQREATIELAAGSRVESSVVRVAALVTGVLIAAGAGWLALTQRMAGMDNGPGGDPGTLGWFVVTWAAMTAAMMLPVSLPAAIRIVRERSARAPVSAAVLFLAGYGAVWMLAGLAGYTLVQAIRGLDLHLLAWSSAGRYVAGASVAAAGLYQLTGAKGRWLARCSAPELQPQGRRITGATLAGVRHGCCCVACCWTLMVALYALGMMSTIWTIVVTVLIAGERLLPRPRLAAIGVAAALVALGVTLVASPASVPALTVPSRAPSMTMASGTGPGVELYR